MSAGNDCDVSREHQGGAGFKMYKPIKQGGAKMLVLLAMPFIYFYWFTYNIPVALKSSPGRILVYGFIYCISIVAMHISLYVLLTENRKRTIVQFFRDYWKRNVIGYYIVYRQELECEERIFLHVIDRNGEVIFYDGSSVDKVRFPGYALAFPLGGWFKKPRIVNYLHKPVLTYKVRLVGKCFKDYVSPELIVTDGNGATVQWSAGMFLSFLNQFLKLGEKQDGNLLRSTWGFRWALHGLLLQIEERRKEVLKLGAERSSLTEAIVTARDAIEATTRFGKSKDAKQIREALDKALEKIGDPRADAISGRKPKPPQIPSRIGDII